MLKNSISQPWYLTFDVIQLNDPPGVRALNDHIRWLARVRQLEALSTGDTKSPKLSSLKPSMDSSNQSALRLSSESTPTTRIIKSKSKPKSSAPSKAGSPKLLETRR